MNVEVAQPQHRRRRAIASSSAGARWAALANDHAMLARACGSSGRSRAAVAPPRRRSRRAAPSAGALWPAVANAHAVLASSCGLKSRADRGAPPLPPPRQRVRQSINSNRRGAWFRVVQSHTSILIQRDHIDIQWRCRQLRRTGGGAFRWLAGAAEAARARWRRRRSAYRLLPLYHVKSVPG